MIRTHSTPGDPRRPRAGRTRVTAAAAPLIAGTAALFLATGCGSARPAAAVAGAAPTAAASVTTSPSASAASPSAVPGPSLPPPPTGAEYVTQTENGQTITVHEGTDVLLVLYSSYWSAPILSNPAVLARVGTAAPTRTLPPPVGFCRSPVPGAGCGLFVYDFHAAAHGAASITATRTSCGEAMACSPAERSFSVTIDVVP